MNARGAIEPVFCDFNAGTPALPEVIARFLEVERSCPGNPASEHEPGRRARAVLEDARQRIANVLGVGAKDVVFTSGGTEAANLAVGGLGDPTLPVLLAPLEHPCVYEPAQLRGTRWWSITREAVVDIAAPTGPVGLLCLAHAQGEVGTLQPIAEAATLAQRLRVPLFVDAAQSLGRVELAPVVASGAFVALSPHKAGGLRGHGVLLGRNLESSLRPLLRGGAQELGRRPGTQSPALAAANALAIEIAIAARAQRAERMASARRAFLDGVAASGVEHHLLTPVERCLPNTSMLWFPRVEGRNLMPALDLAGVHASHGSACSSGAPTPPRVLTAMGLDDAEARACVRFSHWWNDDAPTMLDAGRRVGAIVQRLSKKS